MTNSLKKIAAVDLFCGAGGLTHGLERAGINVRLGVDIDPACEHPFATNNAAKFLGADVDGLDAATILEAMTGCEVTLLAGCAPCQPFSTYSRSAVREGDGCRKGRGKNDDWRLVRRFGELVRAVQPDLVTMENVPPLIDQPVFQEFLVSLAGYFVDYRVVDVRQIGLPQSRKRLVLVGSKLGPIFLTPGDSDRQSATVRQTIGSLRRIAAGDADPDDPLHAASKLSATNMQRIRASKPGGTWRDWPEQLRADCHRKSTGATFPAVYGRMVWDEPSPTITTQCFGYGNGRFGHPEQDRAITLREAAMLQGFPVDYSFVPAGKRPSFAQIGRLIGNAVPVPLGEYIGKLLRAHVESVPAKS
ncbi:MAG: hypothetical protein ACD_54C00289G0001 [uncultured bacterium]|nr:MAG: hypothetical protein ACD_54C00289G0001 [uncultured bacterium]